MEQDYPRVRLIAGSRKSKDSSTNIRQVRMPVTQRSRPHRSTSADSAGVLWREFYKEICQQELGHNPEAAIFNGFMAHAPQFQFHI